MAALLFSSPDAMGPARLRVLLQRPSAGRVRQAIEGLNAELEASPLPIVLTKIAGGWRLLTDPQLGDVVARMRKEQRPEKITGAAMETLAIVAYRQPVTKAEVEAIRGVQAGPMLRTLVDRGLACVSGRADLPGSPLQYGTTKDFLERFGLDTLQDLPRDGELTEA
jgi:segregation and condensation protein B